MQGLDILQFVVFTFFPLCILGSTSMKHLMFYSGSFFFFDIGKVNSDALSDIEIYFFL